jgi:hypothetical protein
LPHHRDAATGHHRRVCASSSLRQSRACPAHRSRGRCWTPASPCSTLPTRCRRARSTAGPPRIPPRVAPRCGRSRHRGHYRLLPCSLPLHLQRRRPLLSLSLSFLLLDRTGKRCGQERPTQPMPDAPPRHCNEWEDTTSPSGAHTTYPIPSPCTRFTWIKGTVWAGTRHNRPASQHSAAHWACVSAVG